LVNVLIRWAFTVASLVKRAACLALVVALVGCAGLPPRPALAPTHALDVGLATDLGRIATASVAGHDSGFQLMPVGATALRMRLDLVTHAQRSLDIQTFAFRDDRAGRQIARALEAAASRGVRVRLLIDDLNTAGTDELLLGLDAHPNIEVRLFNPFVLGRSSLAARLIQSWADLGRVNHRMHNKLFVADNAIAIFGGRNIGDDYFMLAGRTNFVDFDVLGAGRVVRDLSASFDDYWNSEYAYPVVSIVGTGRGGALRPPAHLDTSHRDSASPDDDVLAAQVTPRLEKYTKAPAQLAAGSLRLVGADAEVKVDLTDKIAGTRLENPRGTVRAFIGDLMHLAKREIFVVSPYYVPGKESMAWIRKLSAAGVKMTLLTNSLAATDEPLVHAGYLRYRKDILELGVEIFELSPTLARRAGGLADFGESLGRLHAKVIVVDRTQLFVGSMNLDTRSERYNTELGVLMKGPALANDFLDLLEFEASAYRVRLNRQTREVEWVQGSGADEKVWTSEPEASAWLLFRVRLFGAFVPERWL
jgi:putative cardiolipin synthase